MDLQGIAGAYDAIYSIGYNSLPAVQLMKNGLRRTAGPLDWMLSDLPDVGRLLSDRFEGFMDRSRLRIIGRDWNEVHYLVQDSRYGVISVQDFPVHLDPDGKLPDYPEFARRLDCRILQFLNDLERGRRCLFIRTGATLEQTQRFAKVLEECHRGDFRFLVINYGHSDGISTCRWPIERVCSIRLPAANCWTPQDSLWKSLLSGVRCGSQEETGPAPRNAPELGST